MPEQCSGDRQYTGAEFIRSSEQNGNIVGNYAGWNAKHLCLRVGDPAGLAFNSAGNLFVGSAGNGTITEITPDGTQSTFASGFYELCGLAFNSADDLFAADEISGQNL